MAIEAVTQETESESEPRVEKLGNVVFHDKSRITKLLAGRGSIDEVLGEELGEPYREYRRLWEQASNLEVVTDFPIHMGFELNHSCNMRCPMCSWSLEENKTMGRRGWMDFEAFAKIIDEGVERGLKSISLNWVNECLIRKDLPKFCAYAKQKGILDIFIHTNGMLLTEKMSEELIDAGLTRLMVSMDAIRPETYDEIRIGGDLKTVHENIFKFLEVRERKGSRLPLLSVNFVRMSVNEDELEEFIEFWAPHTDYFAIQELCNPFLETAAEEDRKYLFAHDTEKSESFQCAMPFQRMGVTYEGQAMPCCALLGGELDMGNVHEQSISELWNSEGMKEIREIHKKGEFWKNDVCRRCALGSLAKDIELPQGD